MVRTAFTFNGFVRLELIPENNQDKMLLELAFQGRQVKIVEQQNDGRVSLKIVAPQDESQLRRAVTPQTTPAKNADPKYETIG